MAIKVNNTTVINDSRALQNIASVDSATATAIENAGVGGGAFVLVDEVNASSSDTVELSGMDSTYRNYMIIGSDLVMSSGQDLTFTLKQGGSYVTSGYYAAIYNQFSGNNTGYYTQWENQSNQQFTKNNNPVSNFIMYIYNPSNASTRTAYKVLHTGHASGTAYTTTTDGMQNTAGAVTDIKFDASNQTYNSGNFKLYGIGG